MSDRFEADQWQRQYEHAQERYEAQFQLNAELIAGLQRARAEAWDLGWQAREYGHPQTANPYRGEA